MASGYSRLPRVAPPKDWPDFGISDHLIWPGVCGLSPGSALLSVFDRLSAPDRRSPMRCLSLSDRVSFPDRRSFVVRLPSPDRFSSLPIVVSVGCRESCWIVHAIASCRRATATREGLASTFLRAVAWGSRFRIPVCRAAAGGMKLSDNLVYPLLVLLRRHEAANAAYEAAADNYASEAERDHLFAACGRTMQAIIDRGPAATPRGGCCSSVRSCPQ
jgi:hypothetical protein